MVHSTLGADLGLPEFLAARARHATDARLALNAGGGLLAASGALWWRPPAWPLLAGAGALAVLLLLFGVVALGLGTWIS